MTNRLTDEQIADLEAKHDKSSNDYKPSCISSNYGSGCAGAVDEDIDFWRAAVDCIPALLAEIKERREQELTHASNSCLDCYGPLVQCDCQPDCPGGRCARRCWEAAVIAEHGQRGEG